MKLGFNTSGNNQTSQRLTDSVLLGYLRNSPASTTRKFKYCNYLSNNNIYFTLNCVFNTDNFDYNLSIQTYHILNEEIINDIDPLLTTENIV